MWLCSALLFPRRSFLGLRTTRADRSRSWLQVRPTASESLASTALDRETLAQSASSRPANLASLEPPLLSKSPRWHIKHTQTNLVGKNFSAVFWYSFCASMPSYCRIHAKRMSINYACSCSCLTSLASVAFKGNLQKSLPSFFTTKTKLIGIGIHGILKQTEKAFYWRFTKWMREISELMFERSRCHSSIHFLLLIILHSGLWWREMEVLEKSVSFDS